MKEFGFHETRYINSHLDYSEKITNKRKVHKCFLEPNNKLSIYDYVANKGIIKPKNGKEAWDVCLKMADNGLLAKPTHGDIIRFAPPLVITKKQIIKCISIIKKSIKYFH